jgi:hypothetical protein
MSLYAVKKIQVFSLLRVVPIVFAIVGAVIGLFTFFLFPTTVALTLTAVQRLLAWAIFLIIYTALMVIGALAVAWLYNFVVDKFGNAIVVSLESNE